MSVVDSLARSDGIGQFRIPLVLPGIPFSEITCARYKVHLSGFSLSPASLSLFSTETGALVGPDHYNVIDVYVH